MIRASRAITSGIGIASLTLGMGILVAGCGGTTTAPTAWSDITKDLKGKGCLLSACHGSPGSGTTVFKPINDPGDSAGYMIATTTPSMATPGAKIVDITTPEKSTLLTYPVNGSVHTGSPAFQNTSTDAFYVKWLAWIKNSAPLTAPAQ